MTEEQRRSMRLDHYTLRDDTLTHRVKLITVKQRVWVSYNCRATPGNHSKAGKINYSHIGPTDSIEESRRLYNDPANHWAPFGEEDVAKW